MMQAGKPSGFSKMAFKQKGLRLFGASPLNSIAECALQDARDYSVIGAMFASNRMPSMIAVHVDVALTYIEVPAS